MSEREREMVGEGGRPRVRERARGKETEIRNCQSHYKMNDR